MKTIFTLLMAGFCTSLLFGQFNQGQVVYDVILNGNSEEAEKLTITFSKTGSRIETENAFGGTVTIVDLTSGIFLHLSRTLWDADAVSATLDEIQELRQQAENKPEVNVTEETREISGYACRKVVVTDQGSELIYWCTDQIENDLTGQLRFHEGLPGFPLRVEVSMREGNLLYEVREIKKGLSAEQRELLKQVVPSGYTLRSWEEYQGG